MIIIRMATGVVSAYMLLIFIRIMLTWVGTGHGSTGRTSELLASLTDPYLNYFKRFSFLKAGMVDFSPIVGVLLLVVILNILSTLSVYGKITLGIILLILLQALWSAVSFIITLMIILTALRLGIELFFPDSYSLFKTTLEAIVSPLVRYVKNIFARKKFISYRMQMAMTGGILIFLSLAGSTLVKYLSLLLQRLPF